MTGDELRDRIAAALTAEGMVLGVHAYADAVLPVVREAVAAELRAFAVELADDSLTRGRRGPNVTADWILDRAHDRASRWRADQ